jgi:ABC-type sugar transport system substrate-binding protein
MFLMLAGALAGLLLPDSFGAPTPLPPASATTSVTPFVPVSNVDFSEIKATHPWRIAFIPKFKFFGETGRLSSYWEPAWEGAQQAGRDFGVQVRLVTSGVRGGTDAEYVEPQIRLVADLIARGQLDGLVIAPFDSDRLAPVVEKAVAAGIPTVALDTPINSDRVLTFVAFNNCAAGQLMGGWVVKQLNGRGKALILDGPQNEQNATDRRKGFLAGLKTGNIDILNTRSADWEIEPARQITAGWLAKYPDVNVILAANDNMALGAARAAQAAQRPGLLITGFDATDAARAAIQTGAIAATVDQAPGEQARLAIQLLIRHLETGEKFPPIVYLPRIQLVTVDNVRTNSTSRGRP